MQKIELSYSQIENLAKPLVSMMHTIADFYRDPQNEREYREWYANKYGREPKDQVRI